MLRKKKVVPVSKWATDEEFVCVLDVFRSWCARPGYLKIVVTGFTTASDAWDYVQKQRQLPEEKEIQNAKVRLLRAYACRKEHLDIAENERYKWHHISKVA